MAIEIETYAQKTDHGWEDVDGFAGPVRPGNDPRTDPRGDFPTGPATGAHLPNLRCRDVDGKPET